MALYPLHKSYYLILLLVALLPLTARAQQGGSSASRPAEVALREGRYGEALSLLEPLITGETRNPILFILRARAFEGREAYQRAEADYQRALEIDPGNQEAQEGLQRARIRRHKSPRTDLERLRQLVAANPENHVVRLRYADVLYDTGLYAEAADAYASYLDYLQGTPAIVRRYLVSIANANEDHARGERAARHYLGYYPTDDDLHMRLGYFLLWQGKHGQARQAFGQALRLNPGNADAQRGLQEVDSAVKRQQAAAAGPYPIARLKRVLERHPDRDQERFQLVRLLLDARRYFEAYEHLMQLSDDHSTTQRWLNLFTEADRGLVRATGETPIYPVDRLTYLLRAAPDDRNIRYDLVSALLDAARLGEAYDVLTDVRYAAPDDPRYRRQAQALVDAFSRPQADSIGRLQAYLQRNPTDVEALGELAAFYVQTRRIEQAQDLYRVALRLRPQDDSLRYAYARMLAQSNLSSEAREQADQLLQRSPAHAGYQRLYAQASIAGRQADARTEQYLQQLLKQNPEDVSLLLDLSALRLAEGRIQEADAFVRRAHRINDSRYESRIEAQNLLIERALIGQEETAQLETLNEARRLTAAGQYPRAIERYEAYFEMLGKRPRAILKELAGVYSTSGDFVSALSILEALQEQRYAHDVAKEIARNRLYLEDYAGAIRPLETLRARNPGDVEAHLLLSSIYRQLGQPAQAEAVYQDVLQAAPDADPVEKRLAALAADGAAGIGSSAGAYDGMDYVGQIVPVAEATLAHGGGTRYGHWAQGLTTQITLPIPAVLTAGITSHFIHGTRRLIPGSQVTSGRLNQIHAGGHIDLTPPLPDARVNYTNRISMHAGVFDYDGGRTAGFTSLRYWRQEPGHYEGSIGIRSTEGALALWAPAGGEFALRLTQIDVQASTASLLPDSLLRLRSSLAFNVVSHHADSVGTVQRANHGTSAQFDAGYRVLPSLYLGLTYTHLSYRDTVNIYFSPAYYQTYSGWLEYENEYANQWHLRVRGSVGTVAQSNGFLTRHLEGDLLYRLTSHLSAVLSASIGQSARSLGNMQPLIDDRYSTFTFTGSFYWTL